MPIGNQNAGGGGGGASAGSIRAGKAHVEINGDDGHLKKVLAGIKARVLAVGGALRSIGGASIGAGLAGLTGMFALLKSGVDRADKIGDIAEVFGLTPESASKMASAFEIAGGSIEEFETALTKLALVSKNGEPLDETLLRVADALREIPDAAERIQAAKEIFGKAGTKFLDTGFDVAGKLGGAPALTKEQIENSKKLNEEFAKTGIVLQSALLPVLEFLVPLVKLFAEFVRQHSAFLPIAAAVAAGMVAFGTAATVAGFALPGIVIGFKLIAAAVAFLFTPIGAVIALVVALAVVFQDELIGAAKAAWGYLSELFAGVGSAAVETWGGIVAAVKAGDMELAFEIVGKGIGAIWAELMLALRKGWNDFVKWMVGFLKANPWVLPAIGAAVGFYLGGPLGAGIGIIAGGVGALAVNEFGDDVAGALALDLGGAEEKVKRKRAELAALVARAGAAPGAGGAGEFVSPGARKDIAPLADAVKGAFQTFAVSGQRFGYGDNMQKDQLKALLDIKDGKGDMPDRVAGKLGDVLMAAFKPK